MSNNTKEQFFSRLQEISTQIRFSRDKYLSDYSTIELQELDAELRESFEEIFGDLDAFIEETHGHLNEKLDKWQINNDRVAHARRIFNSPNILELYAGQSLVLSLLRIKDAATRDQSIVDELIGDQSLKVKHDYSDIIPATDEAIDLAIGPKKQRSAFLGIVNTIFNSLINETEVKPKGSNIVSFSGWVQDIGDEDTVYLPRAKGGVILQYATPITLQSENGCTLTFISKGLKARHFKEGDFVSGEFINDNDGHVSPYANLRTFKEGFFDPNRKLIDVEVEEIGREILRGDWPMHQINVIDCDGNRGSYYAPYAINFEIGDRILASTNDAYILASTPIQPYESPKLEPQLVDA